MKKKEKFYEKKGNRLLIGNITSEGGEKLMRNMVIVKQRDWQDCGVCCLSSLIQFYGGYIPLEKLRIDTCTTKEGTSAYHLVLAAKNYGFDAIGVEADLAHFFDQQIILPAICHVVLKNGMNHYVCVYKVTKNYFLVMDPAIGKVKMPVEEFLSIWSNIVLIFTQTHTLPVLDKPTHITQLLFKLIPNDKSLYLNLFLTSILLTLFSILTSFYLKVISEFGSTFGFKGFWFLCILFGMLTLFKITLLYQRDYLESYLNKNINIRLLFPFFRHLFSLPLKIVKNRSSGEIVTRVGELMDIKNLFSNIFVTVFLDLFLAIIAIIFLVSINKQLFYVLGCLLICYILIGYIFGPMVYRKVRKQMDAQVDFQNELIDDVEGTLSIKNLKIEQTILQRLEQKTVSYLKSVFHLEMLIHKQNLFKTFIYEGGLFAVNSLGVYLIFKGQLTIISLVTFTTLMGYLLEPIRNIIDLIPEYKLICASFEKISEFIALPEESLDEKSEHIKDGSIQIRDLSYSPDHYHPLFGHLSLEIMNKEHVLLKGPSGCGKSTLCRFLSRLEDDYIGTILIGDVSIKDYRLTTIRENITYLAQREHLFCDTIRNNILLGKEVSLEKLNEVLELCEISEIIENKPLRLETMLIDGGFNLSGGQRQRIILARALLKDTSILILDEALSEVDAELEKRIIPKLRTFCKDKTVIYVSHRNHEELFTRCISLGVCS